MKETYVLDAKVENGEKSFGIKGARQRFSINIVSNLALFVTQILANLWMTPFLIGNLGIAIYGIIPLTQSIISYATVLTTSLNDSLGRFLTIDLGKQDELNANRTFNTSFFSVIGIITALTPVIVVLTILFPNLFNVPQGTEVDSRWLLILLTASFFVSIITSQFGVSAFVHSKFLIINLINLFGIIIRIGLLFLFFYLFPARMWYFGGVYLISGLLCLSGFVWIWTKLTPELHIQPRAFDRSKLHLLVGMSGWLIVNTLGAMLLSRVDLIAINAFFGAAILGGYAAVAQFSTLLDTLITTICSVLRPVLLIKYAQQDFEGLRSVTIQTIKFLGLFLALLVGLLCGFSRPLISIWLGSSFEYLSPVLIVLTAHYSINLAMRPLIYVQQAYNTVRLPGIVTLLCGLGNLVVDILIGVWGKWGYMGIAISTAIIWTIRNTFFTTIYTARVMKLPWWTFLFSLKTCLVATVFVGAVSYGLTLVQMPSNWLGLALDAAIVSVPYALIVWTIILSRSERNLLIRLVYSKVNKIAQIAE